MGSFAPIVCLDNSRIPNKRQKNTPPSTSSTALVVQQPLQPTSMQHPSKATIIGSVAGFHYRSWSSLASNAFNAVTAETPPQEGPAQEWIDSAPEEQQHSLPGEEEQHARSTLQLPLLASDTSEKMEANDHINSATRKADVSDGRFNRKMKQKKDNKGSERMNIV